MWTSLDWSNQTSKLIETASLTSGLAFLSKFFSNDLKNLSLANNQINDTVFRQLTNMTSLEHLDMRHNFLTTASFAHVRPSNLSHLNLAHNLIASCADFIGFSLNDESNLNSKSNTSHVLEQQTLNLNLNHTNANNNDNSNAIDTAGLDLVLHHNFFSVWDATCEETFPFLSSLDLRNNNMSSVPLSIPETLLFKADSSTGINSIKVLFPPLHDISLTSRVRYVSNKTNFDLFFQKKKKKLFFSFLLRSRCVPSILSEDPELSKHVETLSVMCDLAFSAAEIVALSKLPVLKQLNLSSALVAEGVDWKFPPSLQVDVVFCDSSCRIYYILYL